MKTEIQESVNAYEAEIPGGLLQTRLEVFYDRNTRAYSNNLKFSAFIITQSRSDSPVMSIEINDRYHDPLSFLEKVELSKATLEFLLRPSLARPPLFNLSDNDDITECLQSLQRQVREEILT